MSRPSISVVIIACNEENNIRRCLQSAVWADEIIVVDNGSTDSTLSICAEFKCRVIHHQWEGYAQQKNFALSQASGDWILNLDADESVTDPGAEEIQWAVSSGDSDVYALPRMNSFLGKWMRHGGWYPDYQVRLFRRGYGAFKVVPIHECFQAYEKNTRTIRLTVPLQHYTYPTVADFMNKADRYSTLDASRIIDEGKAPKSMTAALLFAIPLKFAEVYLYKGGWKDGLHGFISAVLLSTRVFLRSLKIWEQNIK
ncbi:MAG: glycosyltransferase family 2 protein [Armatimonadota bacterium]